VHVARQQRRHAQSQNTAHDGEGTATLTSPAGDRNDWNTKRAMTPRPVDGAYVQMGDTETM